MICKLLKFFIDLLLHLSLLIVQCLNDPLDDVLDLLGLEASQLWQLLYDVEVEVGEHRVESCLRFLTLLKQLLLEREDIKKVLLVNLCHVWLGTLVTAVADSG